MAHEKSIPEEMRAILGVEAGGPDVLQIVKVPTPMPGPGQVLIRVAHAGVNRPDVVQRMGLYPPPPGAPDIPGLEIAGTVVAVGSGVDDNLRGSRQCALVVGGGYSEYCLAEANHCLPLGADLSLSEAAALPETLFTVWHNLFQRGCAQNGDTMLIHGGTSGIGTMAIMLGGLFDLTVIVTCGDDAKCAHAREIGAALAINYRDADFVEEVKAFTQGRGVNVVLDMVSGDYVKRNIACLAEDGRHVTIAVMGGVKAEVPMHVVMTKRLTLTGSTLRPRDRAFKAALRDEIAAKVWPLVLNGKLRPIMDQNFPLADAAGAHARMEAGDHIGKIVLDIGS